MQEIDIYDFDKTIIPFDSGSLFALYCAVHYPWVLICLPVISVAGLLMLLKIINFTAFKKPALCLFHLFLLKKQ